MSLLIAQATVVIFALAALVFAFQAIRQRRARELSPSSFPTLLLLMIVGWIATEGVTDASGTSLGAAGEWAHLAVMILFAATLTLQLKRSLKRT